MQTSRQGIEFLERHEGVVLRAYRDAVGVWTIGAGLTRASGVVTPKPGMTITRAEASRLLGLALARNYEPAVARVMPGARQHEFDAGVSFHFNTGAVARASWVQAWVRRDWAEVRRRLGLWNKGGGRVLPGLTRRRADEARLMELANYGAATPAAKTNSRNAAWALAMTLGEREAVRAALARLGFTPGQEKGAVRRTAAIAFQRDYGLTQDAIIGRATLSTIQRALDARSKAPAAAGAAGIGGLLAGIDDWALGASVWLLAVPGVLWLCWLGWSYRDAIAAKLTDRAPSVANFLRSI